MQIIFALALSLALPPIQPSVESVFFQLPEESEAVVLELIEPMGFALADPETGKQRMVNHHLRLQADGTLWVSSFSKDDPFGYTSTQLSDAEVQALLRGLFDKGLFNLDPAEVRRRAREENGGFPVLSSAENRMTFRADVRVVTPERDVSTRQARFAFDPAELTGQAAVLQDEELELALEAIHELRVQYFGAPRKDGAK